MSASASELTARLGGALAGSVARIEAISGGDINDAWRVELADGRAVFVKSHAAATPGVFAAEAAGLDWLRGGALRVPRVLAVDDDFLALEWLALAGRPDPARLGRGLAEQHRRGAPSFGLDRDNYLAMLPQHNAAAPDWPTFYIEQRVRPMCRRAAIACEHELDAVLARPDRFGPPEAPARLHGDLWWGNTAACSGDVAVFDPAVYGGHREIDLAMLALFGELPDALVAAYGEVYPLAAGWRERIALHQLYPLAVHAALFGGGYGARVRDVLARITLQR